MLKDERTENKPGGQFSKLKENSPPPPRKKNKKQTTDALLAPQAHGYQNPKDPNDEKQQDANPEECFQRFCHCSNDNPKFSKFLLKKLQQFVFETSSSGGVTVAMISKGFFSATQ